MRRRVQQQVLGSSGERWSGPWDTQLVTQSTPTVNDMTSLWAAYSFYDGHCLTKASLRVRCFVVSDRLRVCPGTLCGISEPSQHEADRGKAEEGERLAVEVLPILGQSTAAVQPRDGAHRGSDKPFRLIRALHDVKGHAPQDLFDRTSELRSLVSAIGVELHQKRIAREEHGHQPNAPVAILDMGGVHDRVHQQALRVDEKVTLLAVDPFTRIIARRVDRGPPFSALFTLWLSMIATVGLASREACSRHFT